MVGVTKGVELRSRCDDTNESFDLLSVFLRFCECLLDFGDILFPFAMTKIYSSKYVALSLAALYGASAAVDTGTVSITAIPEWAVQASCVQGCLYQGTNGFAYNLATGLGCVVRLAFITFLFYRFPHMSHSFYILLSLQNILTNPPPPQHKHSLQRLLLHQRRLLQSQRLPQTMHLHLLRRHCPSRRRHLSLR